MNEAERDRLLLQLLKPRDRQALEDLADEIVADMGPATAGDLDLLAEMFEDRGLAFPLDDRLIAYQIAAVLRERQRVLLTPGVGLAARWNTASL